MELFVVISVIGTLLLLGVHMLDYVVKFKHQSFVAAHLPSPAEAAAADADYQPTETAAHYDQAA